MSLRQLYPDPAKTGEPDEVVTYVDIIAVHGLNPRSSTTHATDTWEKNGYSWLKESLPKQTPNARIWLYKYASTVVWGGDKSSFIQKADEFLERIGVKRIQDPDRPLVLVGHSLGGLLIEQALVNAHNNPKYTHIKDATAGLAFFATPHNGGNPKLLTLGNVTAKIARGTGFEQNKDILETLKDDSIFSGILQEHWRQQILKYQIVSFWGSEDSIVSGKSAKFGTLPGDVENVVKLTGGHSDICRFHPNNEVDTDNLELVLCNLQELYAIALRESAMAFGAHILDILRGEAMTAKYEKVASPHRHTFNWIFEREYSNNTSGLETVSGEANRFREWFRENNFVAWLSREPTVNETSHHLYWILGKAGSGKSTLMKHIYQQQATYKIMATWKGAGELLAIGYFFERGHSSEERLFRSLLHQILNNDKTLIPKVYSELWKQFARSKNTRNNRPTDKAKIDRENGLAPSTMGDVLASVLDLQSLSSALGRAIGLLRATTKLFLLIDGLDEIIGLGEDTEESRESAYQKCQSLSRTIAELASNNHVKICISSRPHLGLEDNEGGLTGCSKLQLESAIGVDIAHFIDAEFLKHPRVPKDARSKEEVAQLARRVKERASGMFLWVSLAVKLLVDGLNSRSRLSELRRKIETAPIELTGNTGLYMQMLQSVDRGQRAERLRMICILTASMEMKMVLSPLMLDFAEEEGDIENLIHEENGAGLDVTARVKARVQRARDRLKSCCGGLFELRDADTSTYPSSGHHSIDSMIVNSVHGTVWDFLQEKDTLEELHKYPLGTSVPGPLPSLLKAAILSWNTLLSTPDSQEHQNDSRQADLAIQLFWRTAIRMESEHSRRLEAMQNPQASNESDDSTIEDLCDLIMTFDKLGRAKCHERKDSRETWQEHWVGGAKDRYEYNARALSTFWVSPASNAHASSSLCQDFVMPSSGRSSAYFERNSYWHYLIPINLEVLEVVASFLVNANRSQVFAVIHNLFASDRDERSNTILGLIRHGLVFCVERFLSDDRYKKVSSEAKPLFAVVQLYLASSDITDEPRMRALRNIIHRLVKAHNKLATVDVAPLYEYGLLSTPLGRKKILQSSADPTALKLLWLQLVISMRPQPDVSHITRLRYLEVLEIMIRNVPDILETEYGKAIDVVRCLDSFDDVAGKKDELRQLIEPTLRKQNSKCMVM